MVLHANVRAVHASEVLDFGSLGDLVVVSVVVTVIRPTG
jgi:hypothetical protein